jgi:hypothetical protein
VPGIAYDVFSEAAAVLTGKSRMLPCNSQPSPWALQKQAADEAGRCSPKKAAEAPKQVRWQQTPNRRSSPNRIRTKFRQLSLPLNNHQVTSLITSWQTVALPIGFGHKRGDAILKAPKLQEFLGA